MLPHSANEFNVDSIPSSVRNLSLNISNFNGNFIKTSSIDGVCISPHTVQVYIKSQHQLHYLEKLLSFLSPTKSLFLSVTEGLDKSHIKQFLSRLNLNPKSIEFTL